VATQPKNRPAQLRHQLNIHCDYGPNAAKPDTLSVKYGYHYSGAHQLRQQSVEIPIANVDRKLRSALDSIVNVLVSRIPPSQTVRLPHAAIVPVIEPASLTFVAQDQARPATIPLARLYYYETVAVLDSRIEAQVRVTRTEWTPPQLATCQRTISAIKAMAWSHYKSLVKQHHFPW
jgi:hypothetical protein